MAELQIPPSINDSRSRALLPIVERLGAIDVVPLLIYRVDSVPASALPFLAWQFDILSPLWQAIAPVADSIDALTDIDALTNIDTLGTGPSEIIEIEVDDAVTSQRELIKMAIQLHRFRGTPWAIKNALGALGWAIVSIQEGQTTWGGTDFPADQGWAVFRVRIHLAPDQSVDSFATPTAIATIDFFKPARSWLDSLWYVVPLTPDAVRAPADRVTLSGIAEYEIDTAPPPSDAALAIHVTLAPFADRYGPAAPLYSAHYRHSGITYGANEPAVADSALILNGHAQLHGG